MRFRIQIPIGSESRVFIKNCHLLMSKLQEKTSALRREHPALQKIEFIYFSMFVGHFFRPGSGNGPRDPVKSGSNLDPDMDPDPQHYLEEYFVSVFNPLVYRSSSSGLYPHDPVPAAPPLRDHSLPHRIEPALPVHHLDQGQEDLRPFRSRGDAVAYKWLSVHH